MSDLIVKHEERLRSMEIHVKKLKKRMDGLIEELSSLKVECFDFGKTLVKMYDLRWEIINKEPEGESKCTK